ncbi:unnamed protein product [Tilletia controversa]|nr:unnamed protein product [Tilletia controversa]
MTAEDGFERSSSADPDDSSDGPEVEDVLRHNTEIFKATMQPVVAQSIALKSKVERSGLAESRLSEGKAKWKLASKVKTQYLYQWFEQQPNDYSSHDLTTVDFVNVVWIGHPGDSPNDVSARPWFTQFDSSLKNKEAHRLTQKRHSLIALRAHFRCLGRWAAGGLGSENEHDSPSEKSASSSFSDTDPEINEVPVPVEAAAAAQRRQRLKARDCAGNVELKVEVTTSNLSQARIYISGTHPDAPHNALQYSRRLRLFMMNNASQGGMTAAKLKKELLSTMETSADMGALPREYTRPDYRMPLGKEIDHLMKHLNNRKRLHKDPFAAVHTFVQRNPDLVFAVGVKNSWSIRNLIRHQERMLHLDSSWRNKNENRAPLTMVTVTNEANHMVPCAAYLSANVTASSIESLLRAMEGKVIKEAGRICELEGGMYLNIERYD